VAAQETVPAGEPTTQSAGARRRRGPGHNRGRRRRSHVPV